MCQCNRKHFTESTVKRGVKIANNHCLPDQVNIVIAPSEYCRFNIYRPNPTITPKISNPPQIGAKSIFASRKKCPARSLSKYFSRAPICCHAPVNFQSENFSLLWNENNLANSVDVSLNRLLTPIPNRTSRHQRTTYPQFGGLLD
jgi:hypothetical protein